MTSELLRPIDDAEVEAFEREGVVHLEGAFDRRWIELLRAAVDRLMVGSSAQHLEAPTNAGRFTADSYVWLQDDEFKAYAFDSPAAAIAARLLRSERVWLLYDQALVKEPGTDTETSWHQDGASWPVHGEQGLTIWMPLDPVTADSGGMMYATGAHRGGRYGSYVNVVKANASVEGYADDRCPDFRDVDGGALVRRWDVQPGDCLVHHMWMPHAAGANRTADVRRRAHTTRWLGDDCRFASGRFQLRPMFDPGLVDGDRFGGPHYPEVAVALRA